MLTVGSLFAGIGGFDLGFERAGMRTLWQVEQSEFCRRVLAKHFPEAARHEDVRHVTGCVRRWEQEGGTLLEYVDVLCGGFPCQDISSANPNAVGIAGERSGLWSEYARLVGELRPRYVVVENVSVLTSRGLGVVLGDLAALGYDAEWDCVPASAAGAPHQRDRIWIVAYPHPNYGRLALDAQRNIAGSLGSAEREQRSDADGLRDAMADEVADAASEGRATSRGQRPGGAQSTGSLGLARGSGWWEVEPDVGRVAHGIPARVDRLAALGNALVPQIAEWIGRRIIEAEGGIAT